MTVRWWLPCGVLDPLRWLDLHWSWQWWLCLQLCLELWCKGAGKDEACPQRYLLCWCAACCNLKVTACTEEVFGNIRVGKSVGRNDFPTPHILTIQLINDHQICETCLGMVMGEHLPHVNRGMEEPGAGFPNGTRSPRNLAIHHFVVIV